MRPRQNAGLRADLTNILEAAAVGALSFFKNKTSYLVVFDLIEDQLDISLGYFTVTDLMPFKSGHITDHFIQKNAQCFLSLFFLIDIVDLGQAPLGHLRDFLFKLLGGFEQNNINLFYPDLFTEIILNFENRLKVVKTITDGFHDLRLGDFVGLAFHHDNAIFKPGNHQIEFAFFALRVGRVEHEFTVDAPHSNRPYGSIKRDIGDVRGQRSADNGENVRIVLPIAA